MTVGTKVHQALASLRSLEGQFETFALETQDQQAKQMYNQCRQQLAQMSQQLASRVSHLEQEKPTYKISDSTSATGGERGSQHTTSGMTSSGMKGSASMTNMLDQTSFGRDRSIGSTASTGATGQGNWSSPTNRTGGNKSTKKNSR